MSIIPMEYLKNINSTEKLYIYSAMAAITVILIFIGTKVGRR